MFILMFTDILIAVYPRSQTTGRRSTIYWHILDLCFQNSLMKSMKYLCRQMPMPWRKNKCQNRWFPLLKARLRMVIFAQEESHSLTSTFWRTVRSSPANRISTMVPTRNSSVEKSATSLAATLSFRRRTTFPSRQTFPWQPKGWMDQPWWPNDNAAITMRWEQGVCTICSHTDRANQFTTTMHLPLRRFITMASSRCIQATLRN